VCTNAGICNGQGKAPGDWGQLVCAEGLQGADVGPPGFLVSDNIAERDQEQQLVVNMNR